MIVPNLSFALVVHNEEEQLDDCLKNISKLSNDIILIHDGLCVDNSIKIAQKYNLRLLEMPHAGMCEAHRVDSIEMTKNDWVFVLDADERLSDELIENLPDLISNEYFDAYEFIWPLFDGIKVIDNKWPQKKALFRKSKLKYIGFPHFDLKTNGKLKKTTFVLHHFPKYNNYTLNIFLTKWRKWAIIQAKLTEKNFTEFRKIGFDGVNDWSLYFRFKRKFPELFIFYGFYDFYKSLVSGGLKGGIHSVKSSFMWGAYNSMVYYFVFLNKWKY